MENDNQPQIKQEVKIEDGSAENANPGQKRKGKWENKWKKQKKRKTQDQSNGEGGQGDTKPDASNENQEGQQPITERPPRDPNAPPRPRVPNLEDGLKGFLITCDMARENKCTQEMLDIMNEIADKYYPIDVNATEDQQVEEEQNDNENDEEKTENKNNDETNVKVKSENKETDNKELNIHEQLAKEISEARQKKHKRFFKFNAKCKNIVFIRIADERIDPREFLQKIFADLKEGGQPRTRFTNKVFPILKTCHAGKDIIASVAKELIATDFANPEKPLKFKIEYRNRNNTSMKKDIITTTLVKLVGRPNKVDLNNPDKLIIVEVFKTTCGLSVVDAPKFPNFNIRSYTEDPEQKKRDVEALRARQAASAAAKKQREGDGNEEREEIHIATSAEDFNNNFEFEDKQPNVVMEVPKEEGSDSEEDIAMF
jgi:tRNA acetyltransferase TAN1